MLCSIGEKTFDSHNSLLEETTLTINGNTTDTSGVSQYAATLSNCGKPLKHIQYQTTVEKHWWQRLELWYGKNLYDDETCIHTRYLKWAIRSQDPNVNNDKTMDKVQRLNGSGSDMFDQHIRRPKI